MSLKNLLFIFIFFKFCFCNTNGWNQKGFDSGNTFKTNFNLTKSTPKLQNTFQIVPIKYLIDDNNIIISNYQYPYNILIYDTNSYKLKMNLTSQIIGNTFQIKSIVTNKGMIFCLFLNEHITLNAINISGSVPQKIWEVKPVVCNGCEVSDLTIDDDVILFESLYNNAFNLLFSYQQISGVQNWNYSFTPQGNFFVGMVKKTYFIVRVLTQFRQ